MWADAEKKRLRLSLGDAARCAFRDGTAKRSSAKCDGCDEGHVVDEWQMEDGCCWITEFISVIAVCKNGFALFAVLRCW